MRWVRKWFGKKFRRKQRPAMVFYYPEQPPRKMPEPGDIWMVPSTGAMRVLNDRREWEPVRP